MPKNKMKDVVQRLKHECEERKNIEKKLKQRLAFEKTISAISSRFIAVKNINTAINQTLRDIGRLSGASRAYVIFFSVDGKTMSNTHEWCRKGVSPQIKNLQNIPSNSLPWWVAQLKNGKTIHITDVSKMPKAAKATRELLESQKIKSLLVVPLHITGKLAGFAGFDDVTETGEWNDDDLMLLRMCSDIVGKALESKESEDKLKESENQFRVLAEENPNIIFIHDLKRFLYVNKIGVEVMGYTLEEGYSKNFDFMKLMAPEFRSKIRESMIKHSKGKEMEPFECVFITKKGKRVDVLLSTKLIKYKRRPAIFGIVTDITGRKKAENKIRESEAKFRILFNTAKDAIFLNDKAGRFIDVNQAACKSLGYTKDELLKLSNKDIDAEPIGYQEFKKIRDGKIKEAKFEVKQRRKDGTYNHVEIVGSCFKNKDQQTFIAIARDITKRKKAEDALRESETQFRVLAEENPNMIYIHDFNGVVYANQRAVDMMNYSRKEGYSKSFNFMDFVAPESRPKITEAVIQHIKGKEIEPFECALITKNSKRLDVIIATKLINYRGKPAALGIVTDITDRKKAEAQIKEYAEKLEGKVEERTKKFTNANKELQKRINELERFHNLTVGRELKMIELKQEIKELELKLSAKKK